MAKEYKTSYKVYSAWNYQKEIEDLNAASEQGWQLTKGGCFHSNFVKNQDVRYRYQIDFGKIEDMARYIETFREQGWEYINSTFNGWHYLRKAYNPALPETEYEIFTDRQSLEEMNRRWARFALGFGIVLFLFAILFAVKLFRQFNWPNLIQELIFLIESSVLTRGAAIMHDADTSKSRKGDSALLAVFFAVIILGAAGMLTLNALRPDLSTSQRAASIEAPITDSRWADFTIKYSDRYYLDLELQSDDPMTFKIVREGGETVYSNTSKSFKEENIEVKLSPGNYWFEFSADSGFLVDCKLQ